LATIKPDRQAEMRFVLAKITKDAHETVSRDYAEAHRTVESMRRANKLNESALLLFAISNRLEHVVVALSVLSSGSFELIDQLMHGDRVDAILVPCKAAGLDWATVRAILKMKFAGQPVSETDFEQIKREYAKLSITAAGRVLRFWQVHQKITPGAAGP
jgi:hypothetical protein